CVEGKSFQEVLNFCFAWVFMNDCRKDGVSSVFRATLGIHGIIEYLMCAHCNFVFLSSFKQ
ncbi:conserved hypothetical protein, partial [Trichinella spiralis]|uniref:hypothetical protein n=1 Tax=Trichinella spiralis TaxID=6334 RepID=UPI0001EFD303